VRSISNGELLKLVVEDFRLVSQSARYVVANFGFAVFPCFPFEVDFLSCIACGRGKGFILQVAELPASCDSCYIFKLEDIN
jgi:hypothetical protein